VENKSGRLFVLGCSQTQQYARLA